MEAGSFAKITHDIVIENKVAFTAGETVEVELISPNQERPQYKYVVASSALGKKYELSDADLDEIEPETMVSRHQEKEREELREESNTLEKELLAEGVNPKLADTIAEERYQVEEDLGMLGPEPGTKLSIMDQLKGKEFAPHLEDVLDHTDIEPGTCPQCGIKVAVEARECPSCGWRFDSPAELASRPPLGVIRQDVMIDGAVAFKDGEIVRIDKETRDPQSNELKFLVPSESLGKEVTLSEGDIYYSEDVPHAGREKVEQDLQMMLDSGRLTRDEYNQVKDSLSKKLHEDL